MPNALTMRQEAQDIHDTIEWASKQSWCSGSVTMAGNSWLAIAQINYASRYSHPALKALAPWEGLSDPYRDTVGRGGIPHLRFWEMIGKGLAGMSSPKPSVLQTDLTVPRQRRSRRYRIHVPEAPVV